MPEYIIKFTHTIEEKYRVVVEADSLEDAIEKIEEDAFSYADENDLVETQGLNIEINKDECELLNEDATASASSSAGMGAVSSASPSSVPGSLNGSSFCDNGGTIGSGDVSNPFGPFSNYYPSVTPKESKKKHKTDLVGRKTDKKNKRKNNKESLDISNNTKLYNFDNFKKLSESKNSNYDFGEDNNYKLFSNGELNSMWESLSDLITDGIAYNILDLPTYMVDDFKYSISSYIYELSNTDIEVDYTYDELTEMGDDELENIESCFNENITAAINNWLDNEYSEEMESDDDLLDIELTDDIRIEIKRI